MNGIILTICNSRSALNIKNLKKMKNGSNTVINWWILPKNDSYRENENDSVEKQGISTWKEYPYVEQNFAEKKNHRNVAMDINCDNAPS